MQTRPSNPLNTKCSICGAGIVFPAGQEVVTCLYCGRPNARPVSRTEETDQMKYANERRNMGEFDEAERSYRKVLEKNGGEHEARWGLLLCKYGVMYVEDAASHQRVITCRRARNASLRADPDFKRACADAPAAVRAAYEKDAAYIDQVQAAIQRIRAEGNPWDAFICYKQTDPNGNRTRDSRHAQAICQRMENQGYRVFYAPLSLRESGGANYEAAIFAALTDSPVMLVVGTRKEYLESTWVRSEWKRYLEMIDAGENKLLVPMFLDIDPATDLPEEFRRRALQGIDMSDPGYLYDLEAILKKAIRRKSPKPKYDPNKLAMARVRLILDGKFDEADRILGEIIAQSRECAEAYFLRCMARAGVQKEEALAESSIRLSKDEDFGLALHFATSEQKQKWRALADRQEARLAEAEKKRQAIAEKLKYARALLENGRFIDATRELQKFIDAEPECAEAHLLQCMVQLQVRAESGLAEVEKPLMEHGSFKKALSLADDVQRARWQGYARVQQARFKAQAEARIRKWLAGAREQLREKKPGEAMRQIESVLEQAPECAEAHLLKCMAQLGIDTEDHLPDAEAPLIGNPSFEKALSLADVVQIAKWSSYADVQAARFRPMLIARIASILRRYTDARQARIQSAADGDDARNTSQGPMDRPDEAPKKQPEADDRQREPSAGRQAVAAPSVDAPNTASPVDPAREIEQQHMAEEALNIRISNIGLSSGAQIRDSWEDVIRNIDRGAARSRYSVGNWKILEMGTLGSVVVQLAGFELDERADGKGRAATTWIAAELMTESHRMNVACRGVGLFHNKAPFTLGTGTVGGWNECELRSYLHETVMPQLPLEIRRRAVRVVKRQKAANAKGELVDQATADALWIPDFDEVCGKESRYFELFKNKKQNRVRRKQGEVKPILWWLRSALDSTCYLAIAGKGLAGNTKWFNVSSNSPTAIGVVIGFCL